MTNEKTVTTRNNSIDCWKLIAAIGVIFVHVPFDGALGNILTSIGICGVAFFYIISGYACYGDKEEVCPKIRKRLLRNGIITLITVAIYMLFCILQKKQNHEYNWWIRQFRQPQTWLRMLFLGDFEMMYGSHLWFMIALLWSYVIFYFIARFNLKKAACIACPVFLIIRFIVDSYVNSFNADWHMSGNLIVGALPVMLLGYLIADKKERLMQLTDFAVIISTVLLAAAMFVTVNFRIGKIDISQIFKTFCAASLFLLCLKRPSPRFVTIPAKLGREDSLYIYLFHFLMIVILAENLKPLQPFGHRFVCPLQVAVIAASLLLARIISILKTLLFYRKES
ncbi:MAG: acyltransferase [Treponema sp.]|nr:acyltransferase [Treponema sp.]